MFFGSTLCPCCMINYLASTQIVYVWRGIDATDTRDVSKVGKLDCGKCKRPGGEVASNVDSACAIWSNDT